MEPILFIQKIDFIIYKLIKHKLVNKNNISNSN